MEAIRNLLLRLAVSAQSEKGQTVIEYILVIVLVALVLVAAFVGGGVQEGVQTAADNIRNEISQ